MKIRDYTSLPVINLLRKLGKGIRKIWNLRLELVKHTIRIIYNTLLVLIVLYVLHELLRLL